MLLIKNDFIPFKGYKCINLCGILFIRNNVMMDEVDINHEKIHSHQIFEMLIIFFYIWYVLEWFVRLFQYKSTHLAYRNISFEREAYTNEYNLNYEHKFNNWLKYLKVG